MSNGAFIAGCFSSGAMLGLVVATLRLLLAKPKPARSLVRRATHG